MEDIEAGSGSELEEEEPPPPPPEPTILEALHANDLDAVEAAIRRGEDMEQTDPERDHATPLILSVQKNMVELAENLIVRSAVVNARKGNGDTALHWACYKGNVRLVKALLAAGSDIEAEGEFRNRPLHLACTINHREIAHILINRDCNVGCRNEYGNTPDILATCPFIQRWIKDIAVGGDPARRKLRLEEAVRRACDLETRDKAAVDAAAAEAARCAVEGAALQSRKDEEHAEYSNEMHGLTLEVEVLRKQVAEFKAADEERERLRLEEEERLRLEAEAKKAKKGGKKKK